MRKPILTFFYQFNPWQSSIGGIQSIIKDFIKYAPEEFQVRLVGTGKTTSSISKWQSKEYAGRKIRFMPLIAIKDDNIRGFIPTSIKYTAALFRRNLASDFMHFHRIEPSLMALGWKGEKTLFVHNDIKEQMSSSNNRNTILWKYFPASYYAMENVAIQQFDKIYVCNTESLNFYQQKYSAIAPRIAYLKNAVDDEVFYPLVLENKEAKRKQFARQRGLAEATRFVLFAGRLHPQKDPILLIRSFVKLKIPNIHLLIAGEGELAKEVRAEIASLGLSQRVTMLGIVERQKLAELYRLSSAFILTSVYEGLPIVVLEALACGTPIVTTKAGETPNFITFNSGVIARNRSSEAIAEALNRVLRYPENYSSEACVRVALPYVAKRVIREVYEQMWQRWERQNSSSISTSTS